MKIVFDSSIHFGQFCTNDEKVRVACKNSQIAISTKPASEITGIVSFNENSWVDHIIWDLTREQQDTFYPFMDVFHSVKNIERIPLKKENMDLAFQLSDKFNLEVSDAFTCAVAILGKADAVHTYYPSLLDNKSIKDYLLKEYNIEILQPSLALENTYTENGLEESYKKTLDKYIKENLNLFDMLLKDKSVI